MSKNPPDFLAFLPIIFLGTGTVLITYLIGKKACRRENRIDGGIHPGNDVDFYYLSPAFQGGSGASLLHHA